MIKARTTAVGFVCLSLMALASTAARTEEVPTRGDVPLAVEKGLFFVEQTAIRWWKERKCASCHDGPMLLFSHNIAKRRGFPIDQSKLDFWTDRWILVDGLVHKRKDGRQDAGGMLSAPLTMLFRDLEKGNDPLRAEKFGKLVQIAGAEWQAEDGSWKVGSKLNYAPWVALALESIAQSEMPLDGRVRAEILDRSRRTEMWIATTKKDEFPERTENVASWMVYEHRKGNQDRAHRLLDELRRRRREDGTWGITGTSESGHLIVTGAVLFVLTSIGLDTNDPLVASTQQLLLEQQKEDGRWQEGGRIFDDGSDGENPVFNLWATALICAGLSQTIELPEGTKAAFTPDPAQLAAVSKMAAEAADGYTGTEANPVDKDFFDEPAPDSTDNQNKESAGYENSLGMKMIRVDPGEFAMGSDHGDWDEAPKHQVRITRPFYIGATEVTNAQYEQFDPSHRELRGKLKFSKHADEAVVFVSWHDAIQFCQWLSKKEGKSYRLPTEAEWEYACRAGTTTAFHTGKELAKPFHKNVLRDSWHGGWYPSPQSSAGSWYSSRKVALEKSVVPLTVAQTPPNPWGLFDMHGNVEEWCSDWYGSYPSGPTRDPVGPPAGDFRVTRGGSHSTELKYLRSANRMGTLPDDKHWLIGFRVVQSELPTASRDDNETPGQKQRNGGKPVVNPQAVVTKRDHAAPYFEGPRLFVKIPPGSNGPLFSRHSHAPAIADCPNGDLLAIWYTCRDEPGRELAVAASRLRAGESAWEPAQPFWDVPDRNDHTLRLCRDEQGKLYHFNGLSAAATWGNLAVVMRTSADSGNSWSAARLVMPEHNGGVGSVLRLRSGTVTMVGESRTGPQAGGFLWTSTDNGRTWTSGQPNGPPPQVFTQGTTGPWIAGTHIALVELKDGRLLALARGSNINGRMPQSISADGGRSWTYQASPFDPIAGRQRPVLLRMREGPILFASFAKSLSTTDRNGKVFNYSGLFVALSYDEGNTWKFRRPITIDGQPRQVEGIGKRSPVTISPHQGEPTGYLAVCQPADGIIHLITSRNHYAFNKAWLETDHSPAKEDDSRTSIDDRQPPQTTNRDRQIDQLFDKWNRLDMPGCAVGVVQDGKQIYGKGFGTANLDYEIANTTRTVFEAGSMAMSFTCACIALLMDQGKISPIDDNEFVFQPATADGPAKLTLKSRDGETTFVQVELATPTEDQLTEYAGRYFSDELDLIYTFTVRDGALWMRVGNRRWQQLQATLADEFIPVTANADFDNRLIRFRRNDQRSITDMAISLYRISEIVFGRVGPDTRFQNQLR